MFRNEFLKPFCIAGDPVAIYEKVNGFRSRYDSLVHTLREKKKLPALFSQYLALYTTLEQSIRGLAVIISSKQVAALTKARIEELQAEVLSDKKRVSEQYALAEQLPHASPEMDFLKKHTRDLNRRLVNFEKELPARVCKNSL